MVALAVVVVAGIARIPEVVVVTRRAVVGVVGGAVRAARSGPTITTTSAPRVSATGGGLAIGWTAVSGKANTLATSLASLSWQRLDFLWSWHRTHLVRSRQRKWSA